MVPPRVETDNRTNPYSQLQYFLCYSPPTSDDNGKNEREETKMTEFLGAYSSHGPAGVLSSAVPCIGSRHLSSGSWIV